MKGRHLALCLNNDGYKASLEVGKVYPVIKDRTAEKEGYLRVIDESGDDYAFAADRFHIVEVPLKVKRTLAAHADVFASLA
ncbi:MAG: hypothetical protein ABI857_00255 [Acidobacteriota bacterium]